MTENLKLMEYSADTIDTGVTCIFFREANSEHAESDKFI